MAEGENMETRQQAEVALPANFWCGGAKDYNIGSAPSRYVSTKGKNFLAEHLSGRGRVADFGCWTGRNIPVLSELAGTDGEVVGVDGPWARQQMTKAKTNNPTARIVEACLVKMGVFPDGHFDGATCWRVLHAISEPGEFDSALAELHRVLRPDAPLLVAVRGQTSQDLGPTPIRRTLPNGNSGTRTDLYFSPKSLQRAFGRAGFHIRQTEFISEGEMVDDHRVTNYYWVVHLIKRK